jgi:lipid-binding SYLF domain-containing protein
MRNRLLLIAAFGATAAFMTGCSTEPPTHTERAELHADSGYTLKDLEQQDPTLADFVNQGHGYAIFPAIGKGAVGVGGAYGRGEVWEQGKFVGYTDMTQGLVGAAIGGENYSEVIVFQDRDALERFEAGNFSFEANASAIAIESGAGASAKFQNGVSVMVHPRAGLMAEASVAGQKFTFQPHTRPDGSVANVNENP